MDDQSEKQTAFEGGPGSHLFSLRLWCERLEDGRLEWRGRVQHVLSGERRYFRDPQALVEFMETYGVHLSNPS
jgi:hypothetical protein